MSNDKGWKLRNNTVGSIMRFLIEYQTDDCILWPFATKGAGYAQGPNNTYGHSTVCEWTHGPRPQGLVACHSKSDGIKCESKACINPRHLRWDTEIANSADMKAHGTVLIGTLNPQAKLTPYAVIRMRSTYRAGRHTHKDIGEMFGVSTMTAYRAITKRSWNHV